MGSCGLYPMSANLEYIGNLNSVTITAPAESLAMNTVTMSLNSDDFKCRSPIYTGPNCIVTVPADGPAPDGARSSAGTVIINHSCLCFLWYFCVYQWRYIMVLDQVVIGSGMACSLVTYYQ